MFYEITSWGPIAQPVASMTHGTAAVAHLAIAWWFLRMVRGNRVATYGFLVFGAGAASMFTVSAIYHWNGPHHPDFDFWWRLDHAGIWIALAAAYTPFHLTHCPPQWGRKVLAGIWVAAGVGVFLELSFMSSLPLWVSPLLYVAMGWLGFPTALWVLRAYEIRAFKWMFGAGVLATAGGVVDSLEAPVLIANVFGAHELMHVLIVLGTFVWSAFYQLMYSGELSEREIKTARSGARELHSA